MAMLAMDSSSESLAIICERVILIKSFSFADKFLIKLLLLIACKALSLVIFCYEASAESNEYSLSPKRATRAGLLSLP